MVTVRIAGAEDMPAIVKGAREFARMAGVEHLMTDDMESHVATVIGMEAVQVYLAETDEIVGGLGVAIMPFMWNLALTEMSELFFWVYPGSPATTALALLRRVMSDAEDAKIDLATFVALSNSPAGVGRVYEKLGFVRRQESFVKEFSWP